MTKKKVQPEKTPPAKKSAAASRKTTAAAKTQKALPAPAAAFPVAGIGMPAGGLQTISVFLSHLPSHLQTAYVIIQHGAANNNIQPEQLAHVTTMPVVLITDKMPLQPDYIYLAPPGSYVSINNNEFSFISLDKAAGIQPLDYFLSDLSSARQNNAIAIVLPGAGNDGLMGIQAVKAEGGITFALDDPKVPAGRSHSIFSYADFTLSAERAGRELAALFKHNFLVPAEETIAINEKELRKIYVILHNKKGVDFSHYKRTTINRRIFRRMALNKLKSLEEYTRILRDNPSEVGLLYRDLLINVTSFFREPSLYQMLTKKIFPAIIKNRKTPDPIRIWIPACATGEEACSIAISLFEYLGDKAISIPIQIFATDLSEAAIEKARIGIYAKSSLQNVSPQRLRRFFVKIDGSYQIIKPIRDICIFATHNLLKDPPFSRIDLISCQNVMIYLEANPQKKILQAFHYALKPEGFLVLGKSETIGSATDLFTQLDKDQKIYSKKAVSSNIHFDFSIRSQPLQEPFLEDEKMNLKQNNEIDIEKETDKLLLSRYVPASVVVNKDLQILRFNGATANFLQPASGKASLHLLKMVRDELVFELRSLVHRVKKEGQPVKKEGIHLLLNGRSCEVGLEVVPIKHPATDYHFLILFKEGRHTLPAQEKETGRQSKQDSRDRRIKVLEQELREAREHMKSMSEEFEATREELQSANEEVLSSNEELQSINEELETSKEELQSTNEELTTINEELQHRNNDLKEAVEYTHAIVETIREPLVVLNMDLRVRTANKAFYTHFKMNEDETEGFYLHETGNGQWNIPELKKQLAEIVSKNKSFQNFELVRHFPGIGEKILLFNAMRMNSEDAKKNRILLAIEDITHRRRWEQQLKESEERFRLLVQNASDIITVFTQDGMISYLSEPVERVLGYKPKELVGRNIFSEQLIHPEDIQPAEELFRKLAGNPQENIRTEFRLKNKDHQYRIIEAVYINLLDNPRVKGIVANYRDITERKALENQKEEFIGIASHELKTPVTSIKAYAEILQESLQKAGDRESVELIDKLNKQVDRLTNLIKDLLDVTKITRGQIQFRNDYFDINELIDRTTEEMQGTSPRHRFVKELQPVPPVWGDQERIGQVLANLLSNAIKYSPDADKIIIRSKAENGQVTVCVKDFGIGLTREMTEKVFERFFRANDPNINTYPGLGLGLFIASDIVKRHGGKIWVSSVKNKGAEFSFSLPLKKKQA